MMANPHQRRAQDTSGAHVVHGRNAYLQRAWADAYRWLRLADEASPLDADDLESLAISAYLLGRDNDCFGAFGRAHKAFADSGECRRAIRCAFWIGLHLAFRGEMGPASGWFGRAQRLLKQEKQACAEEGYLLLPRVEQCLGAGDCEGAYAAATAALEIGERFGEADLSACALHLQGRALIKQERIREGLALLDEAMVAVSAGELSPVMTGLIYCSVIDGCQQVYALDRAQAWTAALANWCAEQPQLVAFTSACLVHRSEIMRFSGAWDDAIREAGRACAAIGEGTDLKPPAAAYYQRGEVHRLRGEFGAAEEEYRRANQRGFEPQPGLALLRLAQGRSRAAATAISRVLAAAGNPLRRSRLLPAFIEIALEAGEVAAARQHCAELQEIAEAIGMDVLSAAADQCRGAVELAEGNGQAAARSLRRALTAWQELDAPYESARAQMLLGVACRSLDDHDSAVMELEAARALFQKLGAAPDVARIDAMLRTDPGAGALGLTPRELEVVRMVATGKTNKAIADELSLSVRTVDRHVENVFTKLDISSRASATAFAYQNKLL